MFTNNNNSSKNFKLICSLMKWENNVNKKAFLGRFSLKMNVKLRTIAWKLLTNERSSKALSILIYLFDSCITFFGLFIFPLLALRKSFDLIKTREPFEELNVAGNIRVTIIIHHHRISSIYALRQRFPKYGHPAPGRK